MNFYDYIVIGIIAVWFTVSAVVTVIRKKKGACCGCSGCSGCTRACAERKKEN